MSAALRITAEMVREHGPSLISTARRKLRNPADAEDLVQEMWLGALRSAHSFEGRATLQAWLRGILRRRMADRFRRRRLHSELQEESLASADQDVSERFATCEMAVRALRLMPELSALEREALALCVFGDVERGEICAQLGITRAHLRVLLHRARRKFAALAR
jgi:RNA polymerase sigma-70 factor (ECF subfamily)